ncbi:MAG: methylcrotonoyl-CoA carboxylase, partial [Pseudomonadota bacterium]|nr:methylcrotonoyl-CoA carboxylase [Pseudomonadota bacterium]
MTEITDLIAELRQKHMAASQGGGEKFRARHRARGKLFVRERIELILDPQTAFLELSPLAADGLYGG